MQQVGLGALEAAREARAAREQRRQARRQLRRRRCVDAMQPQHDRAQHGAPSNLVFLDRRLRIP